MKDLLIRKDRGPGWIVAEPFARLLRGTPTLGLRRRTYYPDLTGALNRVQALMTPLTMESADQIGMFDHDPRARTTDPVTSHEAAASMKGSAKHQRQVCYDALSGGPLTADEIDEMIGWRATTAGRRLPELRERGLVSMLDLTRPTRSGRRAHLWAQRSADK